MLSVCLLVVAHFNLMCLLLQYRVARLFTEKTATVISRGFQLKHIPSGEVGTVPCSSWWAQYHAAVGGHSTMQQLVGTVPCSSLFLHS